MRKHFFIFLVLLFISGYYCTAQDTSYISLTLERLQQKQVTGDAFFLPGIFPSYISNRARYNTKKKDNNIFYNGLISYTLHTLTPGLSPLHKMIADSIQQHTKALLPKFKNQKGRSTYNFWRTDTSFRFPYTWWIPLLRGDVTLPDDMDDTVLALLAEEAEDSDAQRVHELMEQYTNTGNLKTTFRSYRGYEAYSTWFGKNFPVVFDISVLCNVLSFVQEYNLPWNHTDSASLQLIIKTIQQDDYIKHPAFVSPYYGKTSVILYHLARLMCIKPIPELEALKPQLQEEAEGQLKFSNNILEKMILSSSLVKWGYYPPDISLPAFDELVKDIEQNDLCFFIGNIASYRRQPVKEFLTNEKLFMFYHYCPAYNDALLLEYLVLCNQPKKQRE